MLTAQPIVQFFVANPLPRLAGSMLESCHLPRAVSHLAVLVAACVGVDQLANRSVRDCRVRRCIFAAMLGYFRWDHRRYPTIRSPWCCLLGRCYSLPTSICLFRRSRVIAAHHSLIGIIPEYGPDVAVVQPMALPHLFVLHGVLFHIVLYSQQITNLYL